MTARTLHAHPPLPARGEGRGEGRKPDQPGDLLVGVSPLTPTLSPRGERENRRATLPVLLSILLLATLGQSPAPSSQDAVRFTTIDVLVDPHGQALAAYQVEFVADPQRVTLVGIEGGEHPAFTIPPYYDPKALNQNRVIIAALNTGTDLPNVKARVATLHLRVIGTDEPTYSAKLEVAASPQGKPITADVSVAQGAMR